MKKILALAGSNSPTSINKQLLICAAGCVENAMVEVTDLREYEAPVFSPELKKEGGFPEKIQLLYSKILESHGFIIASPEYNGLVPAVMKNTIDWLSSINMEFLGGKPTVLMSTSPGSNGGASNLEILEKVLHYWGGRLVGSFALGNFHDEFDQERLLVKDEAKQSRLNGLISQLEAALNDIALKV